MKNKIIVTTLCITLLTTHITQGSLSSKKDIAIQFIILTAGLITGAFCTYQNLSAKDKKKLDIYKTMRIYFEIDPSNSNESLNIGLTINGKYCNLFGLSRLALTPQYNSAFHTTTDVGHIFFVKDLIKFEEKSYIKD